MVKVRPWGNIDWLLPRIGDKHWKAIVCASFEARCVAVSQWIAKEHSSERHYVVKVNDPPNQFSKEINGLTDQYERNILSLLGAQVERREMDLLADPGTWNQLASDVVSPGVSLLLDITTMPKRMFLFLVKRLLSSPNVQDLVVCYTRPARYKEGRLTDGAQPPAALPGFARVASNEPGATVVVSVGYMAFNLSELLEQSRGKSLKFLFPFPPGSPSVRRSWNLFHQLAPAIAIHTEIRRIHSMDMFAAFDWLIDLGAEVPGAIDMIPLGPKPHALAMALAHQKIGERAELLYSQPLIYYPDYSSGIRQTRDGAPDITAYCLRRDYNSYI